MPGRRQSQAQSRPAARSRDAQRGNSGRQRVVGRSASAATSTSSGRMKPVAARPRSDDAGRQAGKGRGGRGDFRMRRGLRAKFMLVMSSLTLAVTVVLGGVLIYIADDFLFNLTKHNGVELAKTIGQLGAAVRDRATAAKATGADDEAANQEARRLLERYLNDALRWDSGENAFADITFVDAVTFEGGSILGGYTFIGEAPELDATRSGERSISIPGRATIRTPTPSGDITIYRTTRTIEGGTVIPVYRFNIKLNNPGGGPNYSNARVWVDVAYDSVQATSTKLILVVALASLVAVTLVIVVANYLAGQITRPVSRLMRDMREVAKGDLDHRTKPHSDDEVGFLAQTFNDMTQQLKTATAAMVEQEKREYELSIAHDVQAQLLPATAPQVAGYEIAAYYKGAGAVSGDYYDFIPLGNDQMGFIVADVSGKGIPGSMVMAVTRTIVRLVAARHAANPAETLKETNRLIAKQIKRGMFVTAFYAVLNQRTGQITFASAGHNPMLVYRAATGKVELAAPKGIAIGFNEGPLFDKNIQQFQATLDHGDQFILYTDGFPEAMNEADEEFGDDEFYRCVGGHGREGAKSLVQGVVSDIAHHRGRAAQSDDLTLIAVRRG